MSKIQQNTPKWLSNALVEITNWEKDYSSQKHWLWDIVKKGPLSGISAKWTYKTESEVEEGEEDEVVDMHKEDKDEKNSSDYPSKVSLFKSYTKVTKKSSSSSSRSFTNLYWRQNWDKRWSVGFDLAWVQSWARISRVILPLLNETKKDEEELTKILLIRTFNFYLPLYFWILEAFDSHLQTKELEGMIVGFSAVQGSGKTTLVNCLKAAFLSEGISCCTVSIDDFYLTNEEQGQLASANPSNPILQLRGSAGTHDVILGRNTLVSLKYGVGKGDSVRIPVFDKSLKSGSGDRTKVDVWPVVKKPVKIILFEGWMLGMSPVSRKIADEACVKYPGIDVINENMHYYSLWHSLVDCWILLQADDLKWVYDWRKEQETLLRLLTNTSGKTDSQIDEFVDCFWPSYMVYSENLWRNGPNDYDRTKPLLRLKLNKQREPLALSHL